MSILTTFIVKKNTNLNRTEIWNRRTEKEQRFLNRGWPIFPVNRGSSLPNKLNKAEHTLLYKIECFIDVPATNKIDLTCVILISPVSIIMKRIRVYCSIFVEQ